MQGQISLLYMSIYENYLKTILTKAEIICTLFCADHNLLREFMPKEINVFISNS